MRDPKTPTTAEETAQFLRQWGKPTDLALIGEGETGTGGTSGYPSDWNRGTKVRIYRNKTGGYAVSVEMWTQWQGESGRLAAWTADDPESLQRSLRNEAGHLSGAELEAWMDACSTDDDLAPFACEAI